MSANSSNTTALILAGGQSRRMGYNDKSFLPWQNKMLIEHVITAIQPQISSIMISSNQINEQYQQFGFDLVKDTVDGFQGPLAGIYAAMLDNQSCEYFLVVPCDCPTPPADLFQRLATAINTDKKQTIAIVDDGERWQPLFGLYHRSLLPALEETLSQQKNKVMQFIKSQTVVFVDFSDNASAFKNFNQPEDMQ